MSVYKNMAFSLENLKIDKKTIEEKVNSAAKLLQIEDYLQRKPKALSGGQRQRVAIGRAIVRDPKAFLFDEPLSNLDAELRVTMRKELSALHEKIGGTMIYVTHDQVEAMTLADQIVVLNEGYVAQAGAPLDLYNNPNDTFVAGFIGSPKMNFLNVKSFKKDDGINLKSESLNIKSSVDVEVNENYTLGIRPEHIYICEKNESDLEVTVDYSEQLGSETYFYCNANDTSQLIVHQTGQYKVAKGDKLFLRLDRSAMHLFGADGKAIKKNKS
jgi:multiple sugar transport system ATP-binding protein